MAEKARGRCIGRSGQFATVQVAEKCANGVKNFGVKFTTVQVAMKFQFTPASPIDFELVAHKVALQVAKGTADMTLFEREFWSCYLTKLRNGETQGELTIVEENGESTAVIAEV